MARPSNAGKAALAGLDLGADCVRHARMFFDPPDYDFASAASGSFAIAPVPKMIDAFARDYENTTAMIFGAAPSFDDIMASAREIEESSTPRGDGSRPMTPSFKGARRLSGLPELLESGLPARFGSLRTGQVLTSSSNPAGRHRPQT
jgi:hypothetical protein